MTSSCQYTLPSEDQGVVTLLENVLKDNLDQAQVNTAYDDLSEDYDKILSSSHYHAPHFAAETVSRLISEAERPQKVILDIGAGTGMVAEELKKKGFAIFDALDPSPGMLEQARKKNLYRKYICEAIGKEPLDIPPGSYDIITVVGSHTKNHIKSDALDEMVRLVKPGGVICIVARMEGFYNFDEYRDIFFPLCDQLEKNGKWRKIECSECPFWNTVKGLLLLYRVC